MKQPGQVVLFRFPRTDLEEGILRPAVLLKKVPGDYDDWLICMVSSRLHQLNPDFDDLVHENDPDYLESGLKVPSVIRVGRLAVVNEEILIGSIGNIGLDRLARIKNRIADWLSENS